VLDHDDFVMSALVEEGLLDRPGLERAVRVAVERRIAKSQAAVDEGLVPAREVALVRATICECPFVDVGAYAVDITNASMLQRSVAEATPAFPLFCLDGVTTVGMTNPLDLKAVDQLRSLLKCDIEPVLCDPEALRSLISRAYSLTGGGEGVEAARAEQSVSLTTGQEPIVAAINQIIAHAVDENASDIHLGPDEQTLHLRYRIDGTLQTRQGPPLAAHPGLVQRLKVMANLDLTVTRRPQDGKFRFDHAGRAMDVRLSIIPTVCGENAVMRLLASGMLIKGFPDLGVPARECELLEQIIQQPHGMILVTGPTGSGKTTTLYTAIKRLNTPDVNIMTIEDPVEIRLPLVRQVQVNTEIGMTFAGALRSILRQDPDVVLVGEIRDQETARIALQAALTGHLVLSTLHTNDAPGAIARLADFGCPGFAINASLLCIIAQRLVKKVCPHCAVPDRPEPLLMTRFGIGTDAQGLVRGSGCARCSSTGYRGRLGVYELLRMSPAIERAIDRAAPTQELAATARADGMRPMWMDGLEKARVGLTTLEEVARVVALEMAEGSSPSEAPYPETGNEDCSVRLSA
jgi:type IV pilus assembly protein PilB